MPLLQGKEVRWQMGLFASCRETRSPLKMIKLAEESMTVENNSMSDHN